MTREILIAIIAYGCTLVTACAAPFWLNGDWFKQTALAKRSFKISLSALDIVISGEIVLKLFSYYGLLLVLDITLPGYLCWAIALIVAAKTSGFFSFTQFSPQQGADDAIARLARAEIEFVSARNHLTSLSQALLTSASELKERESIKDLLEVEISKKEAEHAEWKKLSEQQKDYLIRKAHEYAPKRSGIRDWVFVILGIGGNVVASALWAWAGNPGRAELSAFMQSALPLWLKF